MRGLELVSATFYIAHRNPLRREDPCLPTSRPRARVADFSRQQAAPSAHHHLATCRSALKSDRAVAEILGVSPSQVSRWRAGQIPDPDTPIASVGWRSW